MTVNIKANRMAEFLGLVDVGESFKAELKKDHNAYANMAPDDEDYENCLYYEITVGDYSTLTPTIMLDLEEDMIYVPQDSIPEQVLIEKVLEQLKKDLTDGRVEAVEELLYTIKPITLRDYLPRKE